MKINSISSNNVICPTIKNNANFKGRYVSGTYYEDNVIDYATKIVDEHKKINRDDLKKDIFELIEDSKTSNVVSKIVAFPCLAMIRIFGKDEYESNAEETRQALGIATLGLSEVLNAPEVVIRKLCDNRRVTKMLQNINDCMADLLKERENKS